MANMPNIDLDAVLRKNGYELKHEIGEGAFAQVREAVETKTGRSLAVKVIDTSRAPQDFVEEFFPREIAIMRKLRHSNIIRVRRVLIVGHYTCIVMDLASGGDFLDVVLEQNREKSEIKRMFREMTDAVVHCHALDICHGDLKCENVLIDENGTVKLADFGFARETSGRLSETFCGSPAYVAPELLLAEAYDSLKADVWSMGVILYMLLTGAMPFDESDTCRQLACQLGRVWSIPEEVRDELDADCIELLERMLEPDVEKRISAAEIRDSRWLQ